MSKGTPAFLPSEGAFLHRGPDHEGHTIDLLETLKRTIRIAGPIHPGRDEYRWASVKRITGHGSGVSMALCRWAGVDPNELQRGPERMDGL